MKVLTAETFDIIYTTITKKFKENIQFHIDQLKNGSFSFKFDETQKIKSIKIFNIEKEFLRLRGVYIYHKNEEILLNSDNYTWFMGGKRLNIEYDFVFNKIINDDMIFTNEYRPWVTVTFKNPQKIDSITILTRIKDIYYRKSNYLALDVSKDGKEYQRLFTVADLLESLIDKVTDSFSESEFNLT